MDIFKDRNQGIINDTVCNRAVNMAFMVIDDAAKGDNNTITTLSMALAAKVGAFHIIFCGKTKQDVMDLFEMILDKVINQINYDAD